MTVGSMLLVVLVFTCAQLWIISAFSTHEHISRKTPATITTIPNGKIPLTSHTIVNCPTKQNAALQISVNETSYFTCFNVQFKSPVFTVHEIRTETDKDLPRPDVDPWYPYNGDKDFGNGKAIIGGYDRGHLSPSADFSHTSTEMMQSTFYVMNRAAQVASFNRNSWRVLETIVRTWVYKVNLSCKRCQVKILTGTTSFSIGTTSEVMGISLPIPKYYYKVVMVFTDTKSYAVLFFGSNDISLTRFPISIIGSSEDVLSIPAEILHDLSSVMDLQSLLLNQSNGLLRADGKQQLLLAIPDAIKKLS